ncbi:MAG: hypothetical protein M3R04_05470 [bacterium]|nr:hypothetical protein [bacterium]
MVWVKVVDPALGWNRLPDPTDFIPDPTPVVIAPPTNSSLPAITGTLREGQLLTASLGTWTGTDNTYAFVWRRGGGAITGATTATYLLTLVDVGSTITVSVTATNGGGAASATSPTTAAVAAIPVAIPLPTNTALPIVTGVETEGNLLSTTTGTWTASASNTYTYVWKRNDVDISGGAITLGGVPVQYGGQGLTLGSDLSTTYLLVFADVGSRMSVMVTATNVTGTASATSVNTGVIAAATGPITAPVNTVLPVITGTAQAGQTLSATTGTWTGVGISYTYAWRRGGVAISGATVSTYLLAVADVGATITVTVTATNTGGATVATSAATGTVAAAPVAAPTNTALPTISGSTEEGQTLSSTTGTWTGTDNTYARTWKRSGVVISGATGVTYVLVAADVGATITVTVTATNAGGSASATSTATGAITAIPVVAPPPSSSTTIYTPVGLLLAITQARTVTSISSTAGHSVGLLLTLTKAS